MNKLVLAGFPCTEFSIAQNKNRINKIDFTADEFLDWKNGTPKWWNHIDEFERQIGEKLGVENYKFALGLQLFFNCLVVLDKLIADGHKPYYLFENVSSMKKEIKQVMTEIFVKGYGGGAIEINSALVSAQNRKRIYFHNFGEVPQPDDRGILLRDVLESGYPVCEKAYTLDANYWKTTGQQGFGTQSGRRQMVAEPVNITHDGKSQTLKAQYGKNSITNFCCYSSTYGATGVAEPVRIGTIEHEGKTAHDSQQYRVYSPDGKSVTLCGQGGGVGAKTGLYAVPADGKTYPVYEVQNGYINIKGELYEIKLTDGYYIIRKLTPIECERLQTLPDNYTLWGAIAIGEEIAAKYKKAIEKGKARLNMTTKQIIEKISNTQRYKALGNGWTAEVIKHILKHANIPLDEEITVVSMYDGIATGRYCLDSLGYKNVQYHAYEIDKYAIQIATKNYPDITHHGDAFQVRGDDWGMTT